MLRFALPWMLVLTLGACGNAALHAAEKGDSAKLRAEIAGKHQRGKLSNDEAANLARAVAEREIVKSKDESTALARLHETRGCAAELDDAFEERMKTRDGAGAEAALARLEDGKLGEGTARDWLDDADDRWRAVGVRTLHRSGDRKKRQAALLDPSPRVRRSAIRAARTANDSTDLDILFETARVDPDLLLRNEALRSMSAIVRTLGKQGVPRASELAIRLRDLWTAGDDALKEDVAVAWGLEPIFENGGREALRVAVASEKGPGAIAAAGMALRLQAKEPDLKASAASLIARTIDDGTRRDRFHALAVARPEGPMLEAIRKASHDDDQDVKVAALAHLLDVKADRDAARKELLALAPQNPNARQALAAAGDLRVQAWLEQDLAAPEAQKKMSAASALAALGRPARAAPLLADGDPSIRTRAACTLLVASRH